MFTRPHDLTDHAVAAVLRSGWGIDVDDIEYAPVGFGGHHWWAATTSDRWFLTVDDLDARLLHQADTRLAARDRLVSALSTAISLRSVGCEFVVAPIPSESGRVVEPIDDRYVLAVYPHVDGMTGSFARFDTRAERVAVVELLVRIHDCETSVPAGTDDYAIPRRNELNNAMAQRFESWSTGPFAEPAGRLLQRHHEPLQQALAAYDELVSAVRAKREPLVVTHGEPHRGNVILARSGPLLIDWDTTLVAPPERDLWRMLEEDPGVRRHYEQTSGRALDDDALRMFSLWWDLCEVALFIDDFRQPHRDTDDTRTAWQSLQRHLDPERWAEAIDDRHRHAASSDRSHDR